MPRKSGCSDIHCISCTTPLLYCYVLYYGKRSCDDCLLTYPLMQNLRFELFDWSKCPGRKRRLTVSIPESRYFGLAIQG